MSGRRFTTGRVGRFGFDDANRLMDAADKVDGLSVGERVEPFGRRVPFLAKLTAESTAAFVGSRKVFDWQAVAVDASATPRDIITQPIGSDLFTPSPNGRAVLITGDAAVGDIVTLVPIPVRGSEVWFAIVQGGGGGSGTVSVLQIESASEIKADVYAYSVTPVYVLIDGSVVPNVDVTNGPAFNLYELGNGHGQSLSFNNPNADLRQSGHVTGLVLGFMAAGAWAFDAVPPFEPECQSGLQMQTITGQALSRGIA